MSASFGPRSVRCYSHHRQQATRRFGNCPRLCSRWNDRLQGQLLATGGEDGQANIWRLPRPAPLRELQPSRHPVTLLRFDPTETNVAAGSMGGIIRVYDLSRGAKHRTLKGHATAVRSLDWHPLNASILASGAQDCSVKLWDTRSKEEYITYRGHSGSVRQVKFSPNGRWLLSASEDRSIMVWDLSMGRTIATLEGHTAAVASFDFHPSDLVLVSSAEDRTVRLWSLETFEQLPSPPACAVSATHTRFLDSGDRIVSMGPNFVKGWTLNRDEPPTQDFSAFPGWATVLDLWHKPGTRDTAPETPTCLVATKEPRGFVAGWVVPLKEVMQSDPVRTPTEGSQAGRTTSPLRTPASERVSKDAESNGEEPWDEPPTVAKERYEGGAEALKNDTEEEKEVDTPEEEAAPAVARPEKPQSPPRVGAKRSPKPEKRQARKSRPQAKRPSSPLALPTRAPRNLSLSMGRHPAKKDFVPATRHGPVFLDIHEFLPGRGREQLTPRGKLLQTRIDSVCGDSSTDGDIQSATGLMNWYLQSAGAFREDLQGRKEDLQVVTACWEEGQVDRACKYVDSTRSSTLTADFMSAVSLKGSNISLANAVMLLPSLEDCVRSPVGRHASLAMISLAHIFQAFEPVVRSSLDSQGSSPANVDLAGEERRERSRKFLDAYRRIFDAVQTLPAATDEDAQGSEPSSSGAVRLAARELRAVLLASGRLLRLK